MRPPATLKVVIRCRDFAASRSFYGEVLGFREVEAWQEREGQGCIFRVGGRGAALEIYQMSQADPRWQEAFERPFENDKVDVQIGVASLEPWCDRLRDRWPFSGPEVTPWGQRGLKLRDPDGLLLAIYEEARN